MNEPFDNGVFGEMFDEPAPKKKAGVTQVLQEKVFGFIRKVQRKKKDPESKPEVPISEQTPAEQTPAERKSFIPRFSFKAPAMLSGILHKMWIAIALVIFTVGVLLIYTELPTHPTLIFGLIFVSLAGNIITNRG